MLSQRIYCGSVIKLQPCPLRRELINIGVIIVAPEHCQWGLLLAQEPPVALKYLTPDTSDIYATIVGILKDEILRYQSIAHTLTPMQNKVALDEVVRPREQMLQFSSIWTLQSKEDLATVLKKEYLGHVSAPMPE